MKFKDKQEELLWTSTAMHVYIKTVESGDHAWTNKQLAEAAFMAADTFMKEREARLKEFNKED